ncbi:Octaprenyl diphosphate synthase [invertebrate metagenome]|uniref:Octaprenyl diphosphate synthase n=1 Tax=invertebrate metagenome TaxID=1711999 RepID=A0A2H9TCP8_9ZZZZ
MPENNQYSIQAVVHDDFMGVNRCIRAQLHSDVALIKQIGHHIIQSGGKRLRPLLVLLTAKACQYKGNEHIPLAVVIEFLHTATLLHDDVVDESDLRRGQDTANNVWGNAPSILVGDFLYSRAFQMMVSLQETDILHVLAKATNVIAEGEVMQLLNIHNTEATEAGYMDVIRSKTAMLFQASSQTAAILAGGSAPLRQNMAEYGNNLGIAFQLIDDVLDYNGDAEVMGKNLGDDLSEGKPTLPLIYTLQYGSSVQKRQVREAIEQGCRDNIDVIADAVRDCGALEYACQRARHFALQAKNCLAVLPDSPYRDAMAKLAQFAVARGI